jgi:hypothetical protein
MHLWIVSDHGHSAVRAHDDLADWFRLRRAPHDGAPVDARAGAPRSGVMVSGNAMAHVYLELARAERPWWPELAGRWEGTVAALLERPAADLVLLPHGRIGARCAAGGARRSPVRAGGRSWSARGSDRPTGRGRPRRRAPIATPTGRLDGDPLGLGGPLADLDADAAFDACARADYPDALVQIAHLGGAPRASELIVSAARDWDLRARYEPIPHVSSHGALHQEHMLVPLLVNRPVARTPRRTVDVMPSALAALGVTIPEGLDGTSFL